MSLIDAVRGGQPDDKWLAASYESLMGDGQAHIVVTLDTKEPIEIGDFVSAFTSVSNQFEKWVRRNHPRLTGEAKILVTQVSSGSIIADLIPILTSAGLPAGALVALQQIDAVTEFIGKYSDQIGAYFSQRGKDPDASESDLKDFIGSVAAIAKDPNGNASLESVVFKDERRQITAALRFNTAQAREAYNNIERHRMSLRVSAHELHERVLMTFVQSNIKKQQRERRTGERVVIENIYGKTDLPLIYASELAESKIKHEIREGEENIYKRGFVVDAYVEFINDRPAAYKVTNIHQVVDLD